MPESRLQKTRAAYRLPTDLEWIAAMPKTTGDIWRNEPFTEAEHPQTLVEQLYEGLELLPTAIQSRLHQAGWTTRTAIAAKSDADLLKLPGIGRTRLGQIRRWLRGTH